MRIVFIALLAFGFLPTQALALSDCVFRNGFESAPTPCPALTIPPGTSWQIQFSGTLDTSLNVAMYDIDLVETPTQTIAQLKQAGRIVICYFSAGSWEFFRPDSADFPAEVKGNPLAPPFADELWLDIRRLDILGPIMGRRLDLARAA